MVDTSVWIDHFEHVDARLLDLVANQSVAMHPFVIGELAAGSIKNRGTALGIAKEDEVHRLLESHRLWSIGLGWVDLHLLTAAFPMAWKLLTSDRAMRTAAQKLGIAPR